jgi:HAD superfamily hydrolase (TIGR01509 family)
VAEADVVVWDFGGVLFDWDPRHLYRKVMADEAEVERFLTEVCTLEWHVQHDAGARFADTLPALRAEHPEDAAWIDLYLERYVEMDGGPIPGTSEIVAELHDAGVPQYGLTNMPHEVWEPFRRSIPLLAGLAGVVVSGTEGVAKPDHAIYRLLAERFALDPARTAFVDDRAENASAATACGFHGIHFTGAEALREELRVLGFPLSGT